jgi:hypothetical protein
VVSLIDDSRHVIYDSNMFIVQATGDLTGRDTNWDHHYLSLNLSDNWSNWSPWTDCNEAGVNAIQPTLTHAPEK